MSDPELFERNMLAVASRHGPVTSERIRSAEAGTRVDFEQARDGSLVPVALAPSGRRCALHSRFDPRREAERISAEYGSEGFYVFLGMGAGYGVEAMLDGGKVTRGAIVEYDASLVRSILERVDLTRVLADRRLHLLVDPSDEELGELIFARFVPALTGDLVTVPLRGRIDAQPEPFQRALSIVKATMDHVSDDYSVQAFFGKRWFANIVRNLRSSSAPTPPVGPIREAAISAAGPSLELAMDELRSRPASRFLIATDTSLRALMLGGIRPQAVVSIDCQHISYYHFMAGVPDSVPVFFDLASPPTVTRLAARPYFFSSGHPLARYVASRFRAFPNLDTSGGNVTHAAVSLAEFLGADKAYLYGADFSYPMGKSYTRGSYIYPYFDARQSRLTPFEGLFSDFLFRNQYLAREDDEDGVFRYVTKPLVAYRERLEALSSSSACAIERIRSLGVRASTAAPPTRPSRPPGSGQVFSSGRAFMSADAFLRSYAAELSSLPVPEAPVARFLDGRPARERDLWTTLLPSAAAMRHEAGSHPPSPERLLADTRDWCLQTVEDEIAAGDKIPEGRLRV